MVAYPVIIPSIGYSVMELACASLLITLQEWTASPAASDASTARAQTPAPSATPVPTSASTRANAAANPRTPSFKTKAASSAPPAATVCSNSPNSAMTTTMRTGTAALPIVQSRLAIPASITCLSMRTRCVIIRVRLPWGWIMSIKFRWRTRCRLYCLCLPKISTRLR